jgi:hypothetical protein
LAFCFFVGLDEIVAQQLTSGKEALFKQDVEQ